MIIYIFIFLYYSGANVSSDCFYLSCAISDRLQETILTDRGYSPADKCQSGVSTALYDKSIKLGTLILDVMENILKIGGNPDLLCVSQQRVVKVVRVVIQNGRRQRYFFGMETYSIIVSNNVWW